MKKIISIVASILLVILLAFGIFYVVRWAKGLERRINNSVTENQNLFRQQPAIVTSVVRSQLKALYPGVDSIINQANIKIKKVENVTNIYHQYIYDTIPVTLKADSGANAVNISASMNCFKTSGRIDFSKTSIRLTPGDVDSMRFSLTGVSLQDTTTNIYYYQRRLVKILFIPLRIGRKEYFSDSYSSCKAKTKTESINLIKR